MSDADDEAVRAVVLDVLPRGRSDDDRPSYQQSPVMLAVDPDAFGLYEAPLADDADVSIGDEVIVRPADERTPGVEAVNRIEYEDLSSGARSELEYVAEEIVEADEQRFVDVYNEAQPITLRLHQLNLLPGIGKKLRNAILDERERQPFASFEDLAARVDGLHDPESVLVERILEEIRDEDLKYRIFVEAD